MKASHDIDMSYKFLRHIANIGRKVAESFSVLASSLAQTLERIMELKKIRLMAVYIKLSFDTQ